MFFVIVVMMGINVENNEVYNNNLISELTTNSANTQLIGGYFSGPQYTVLIKDTLVFLNNSGVLKVIDIKDPLAFSLISWIRLKGVLKDVYVVDNIAYLADREDGFYIILYTGEKGIIEGTKRKHIKMYDIVLAFDLLIINYTVKEREKVEIEIYNIAGQKVNCLENGIKNRGNYSVAWQGSTGIYFVKIVIGDNVSTEKIVFVK